MVFSHIRRSPRFSDPASDQVDLDIDVAAYGFGKRTPLACGVQQGLGDIALQTWQADVKASFPNPWRALTLTASRAGCGILPTAGKKPGIALTLSRNCLCSHIVLLGRFFIIVSNKRSNKKLAICKMLITSILQMVTIALLRRWLWVRAPPNPVSVSNPPHGREHDQSEHPLAHPGKPTPLPSDCGRVLHQMINLHRNQTDIVRKIFGSRKLLNFGK